MKPTHHVAKAYAGKISLQVGLPVSLPAVAGFCSIGRLDSVVILLGSVCVGCFN